MMLAAARNEQGGGKKHLFQKIFSEEEPEEIKKSN